MSEMLEVAYPPSAGRFTSKPCVTCERVSTIPERDEECWWCLHDLERPFTRSEHRVEVPNLKALRESLGVKQTWLARQVGISYKMLHRYEAGRNNPTRRVAKRIAEALRVSEKEVVA